MLIVGFMGSPRPDGLTNGLLGRALAGAASAGAETRQVNLVDYDIRPWPRSTKSHDEELDRLASEADGLILASPVYYKDCTGLMRDFIDYLHNVPGVSAVSGKPGFGIALAGGSGMGQITALRSLYGFFFFRGFRPLDPIPVSRFNYRAALEEAYQRGAALVEAARAPQSVAKLSDKLAHYYGLIDELLLLCEQMLGSAQVEEAILAKWRTDYERARELANNGDKMGAILPATAVYEALFHRRAP